MYKRVLVALGTNTYRETVAEALTIVKDHEAQLCLVHVIDVIINGAEGFNFEGLYAAREREGKTILERAVAQALAANALPEYRLIDGEGRRISSVLSEEVTRWRADLLVMGGRGRGSLLLRHLSDDVCAALASSTSVPILLVAPHGRNEDGRKRPISVGGSLRRPPRCSGPSP